MLALSANNNRGNAYKELRQFSKAEEAYREALAIAAKMDSPLLRVRILTNIASAQFLQGELAGADATARKGLALGRGAASEWRPFLFGVRAQVAHARGDLETAAALIEETFAGVAIASSAMPFRDFHLTARDTYETLGRHREALAHMKALKRLDDESREVAASTNAALMGARFDAANQELRIAKSENRLRTFTVSAVIIGIAGLIVLVTVLIALASSRRHRREVSAANALLTHAARHDPLTDLPNRLHFQEVLSASLASSSETGGQCALLLIDLDRFKFINDTLGHPAGDELLCGVAGRLKQMVGETGHAFRLGGDEFAVLIPSVASEDDIAVLADRIVDRVSEPYPIGKTSAVVGATVGYSFGPESGANPSALTRSADLALYSAKASGRGRSHRFDARMLEEANDRRALESDLLVALAEGQLSLAFQPIVDARSEQIVCREALVRWEHPTRGAIPPSQFVAIAEETGLIDRIGSWVLRSACRAATQWPNDTRVAVNLSVIQVEGDGLVNAVVNALSWSGLSAHKLELEVTESVFLQRDSQMEKTFEQLQNLGVRLVLDDFGTGYSSLSYLQRAFFSKVKIDRSFVQTAELGSGESIAIVKSIVALAQGLGMEATAEGVETEAQMQLMKELGCTELQGYYFGKPEILAVDEDMTCPLFVHPADSVAA
jgi:diguanylate cyclase (GGDEF)-like protein